MHDEGHIIGNHTYTHVILTKIPQEKALEEIYNTNKIIEEITGEKVKYIRPPCGEWNNDMFFKWICNRFSGMLIRLTGKEKTWAE